LSTNVEDFFVRELVLPKVEAKAILALTMAIEILTPIQYLKGVGDKLGDLFRARGINTVMDLLEFYPRTYEDRRRVQKISELQAGAHVSLRATVVRTRAIPIGKSHRRLMELTLADSSGEITARYFRVPFRGYFDKFPAGQLVRVSGKVAVYRGRMEFHHPTLEPLGDDGSENLQDELLPLYTESDALTVAKIRKLVRTALQDALQVESNPKFVASFDPLPRWILEKYNLIPKAQAMVQIHQPSPDMSPAIFEFRTAAQRRLIFEEFFWLELVKATDRQELKTEISKPIVVNEEWLSATVSEIPFPLTGAQNRVLAEIFGDTKYPYPMHRLVQGDVGSGKTVVALIAAKAAMEQNMQVAIMAPTEILARQHFLNAKKMLTKYENQIELLTGHLGAPEKRQILENLKSGKTKLVIGTHALIEDDVQFTNLGLVIIDEQHRFGVDQRNKLRKNTTPHFLVMTATPIPRTLAMTVYGDLDVSIIDEMPPGRIPIVTKKTFASKREKVFGFLRDQVKTGRQGYVIYPLVEESEKVELMDATTEFQTLVAKFPEIRFGLMHGRLDDEEKNQLMMDFKNHKVDVLVSTTVVEVGVDVPNANIIVIEHAERFGLSQLHQLRGRVGRGQHKSFCVLVLGYAASEDAVKRAEVMEQHTSGFTISEEDLKMRGPGEFFGRRQSGLQGFKIADLVRDHEILTEARRCAFELVAMDSKLSSVDHRRIAGELEKKRESLSSG
jgi:ATP-dependent DNA helicase RecG